MSDADKKKGVFRKHNIGKNLGRTKERLKQKVGKKSIDEEFQFLKEHYHKEVEFFKALQNDITKCTDSVLDFPNTLRTLSDTIATLTGDLDGQSQTTCVQTHVKFLEVVEDLSQTFLDFKERTRSVSGAIKMHQDNLQRMKLSFDRRNTLELDLKRAQNSHDSLTKSGRTPEDKLQAAQEALDLATERFNTCNQQVVEELQDMYDNRIDTFNAHFTTIVQMHVNLFAKTTAAYQLHLSQFQSTVQQQNTPRIIHRVSIENEDDVPSSSKAFPQPEEQKAEPPKVFEPASRMNGGSEGGISFLDALNDSVVTSAVIAKKDPTPPQRDRRSLALPKQPVGKQPATPRRSMALPKQPISKKPTVSLTRTPSQGANLTTEEPKKENAEPKQGETVKKLTHPTASRASPKSRRAPTRHKKASPKEQTPIQEEKTTDTKVVENKEPTPVMPEAPAKAKGYRNSGRSLPSNPGLPNVAKPKLGSVSNINKPTLAVAPNTEKPKTAVAPNVEKPQLQEVKKIVPETLKVKALYDYDAQDEDELSFKEDDIVSLLSENTGMDGWWNGELNGKKGVFPNNFVEKINSNENKTTPSNKEEAKDMTSSNTTEENKTTIMKVKALFDYDAQDTDEISFKEDDIFPLTSEEPGDGWWSGEVHGKKGMFPSNFVEKIGDKPAEAPIGNTSVSKVKALYDYDAQDEDELSFKEDDIVTLLAEDTGMDGWWSGELNGKKGVFPNNFVEKM